MENQAPESQSSESVESDYSSQPSSSSSAEQSAQEVLSDPSASAAQKAEAKKTLKSLKIKFNGREYEEELPFEIPDDEDARDYMARHLQMSKLAQHKSQEEANLRKEVNSFIEQLRKNPRKILSDPNLGVDVKQLAAQIIEEEIENSQKSPEQLEKERIENELRELREQYEREKEESRTKEFERLQEIEFERYDNLMTKALESSDLPKSPYVVKKMADYMLMALDAGVEVTPEDILPLVRDEIQDDLKQMFAVMPDEVVEKVIGKDVFNRIRKKNLAKAKTAPTSVKSSVKDSGAPQSQKQSSQPAPKQTFKDFFGV
ncbi:MAG: hypothetical protein EB120_12555 [Proteobacteria bacterium]|nr:hypothetical protein [Pseudomonadota bacterium]NDG27988.1 hypothetical protein [Pseudomonadota bacterium]